VTTALSYDEIEQRVRNHGFDLITTRAEWEGREPHRRKHIQVRSAGGYEQIRRVDVFARSAIRATCQYDGLGRKGETLAVMAAGALTGVLLTREFTPPILKTHGLRLDGWAELQGPNGNTVYLALEHQGDHRRNPRAPVHDLRGGAEVSMRDQARRDALKRDQLARDKRVVLVTIPDPMAATRQEAEMIAVVATELEERLSWLQVDGQYQARKTEIESRLAAGERVLHLPQSWTEDARLRVQAALKASGDHERLALVEADPLPRKVTLRCSVHGVLPPVNINNVLGSVDGRRPGTRCAHCAAQANGDRLRLAQAAWMTASEAAGFRPLFAPAEYRNNGTVLRWQCLHDPAHGVDDSLGHLQSRGCMHCREDLRADARQAAEFEEVRRLLEGRGDAVLSQRDEYVDQNSRIRYRCARCGQQADQAAAKVKLAQRHGCERLATSQSARRAREFDRLTKQVDVLGLELVTDASTYAGNRSQVRYHVRGKPEIHSAAAYLLRSRAARAGR